jgi:hypothetical protein
MANNSFDPNAYNGSGLPPWLQNTVGGLQQGGSPMLFGVPAPRFPSALHK